MKKIDAYTEYDIWETKKFNEISELKIVDVNLEIQYELEF